jgi:hypothetical protein
MPRSKPSKDDGFSGDDEAHNDDMSINDDDSASAESDDEDMVVVHSVLKSDSVRFFTSKLGKSDLTGSKQIQIVKKPDWNCNELLNQSFAVQFQSCRSL